MTARTTVHGLQVADELHRFIEDHVLPAHRRGQRRPSGRASTRSSRELAPKNVALLAERDRLQAEMDAWHKAHPGPIARHAGVPRLPREDRLPACRSPRT